MGKIEARLVECFKGIKQRCYNPKHISYKYYGARGIQNFLDFGQIAHLWQRDNAAAMKKPSIDRIDNDGHYTLENCRFIEQSENSRRKRRSHL